MITYPQHVQDALQELRDKGFAICIFTPKELNGANPQHIEGIMTQHAFDAIEYNTNSPMFDWENEDEEYPN